MIKDLHDNKIYILLSISICVVKHLHLQIVLQNNKKFTLIPSYNKLASTHLRFKEHSVF